MTTFAEVEAAAQRLPAEDRDELARRLSGPPPAASLEATLPDGRPVPAFADPEGLRKLLRERWKRHLADPSRAMDVDAFIAELEAEDAAEAAAGTAGPAA